MKRWKKLLVSLLTVSMTIGASTMSVMAADGYTYKVTLSAGNKGTINGQTKVEQDSVAGSTVTFNLKDVQVTDDKYYVKGIRLSGRDNEEALASPVFDNVTGDADYVVAYGIKKDMVAYTVNYQDASGKALVESQTFYGNVGDKPIVAYQYIENYIPDALALTKTLSNNVSENVFTFTYKPGATDRVVTTTTTITTTVPGTATPGTGTGNVGTAGGTTGGTTGGTAGKKRGTKGEVFFEENEEKEKPGGCILQCTGHCFTDSTDSCLYSADASESFWFSDVHRDQWEHGTGDPDGKPGLCPV